MGNNGNEERVKKCPFLKEWCIGDSCMLYCEMRRIVNGIQQTAGVCWFVAAIQILSEINAKTKPPEPVIKLPHMFKGV